MKTPSLEGGKNSILVIDDAPGNVHILTTLLSQKGYAVQSINSGFLALETVQTTLPDLILLDIFMPGMDGYEVCRSLKSSPNTSHIPVIFLSASDEPLDQVKAFSLGAADFITKPFRLAEVLVRIEHQIKLVRLQQELALQKQQLTEQNQQLQSEIQERQRIEAALRRMSSRLFTLIANLQAGVLVEDEERHIVLVNQTFCDLFQVPVPPETMLGMNCADMAKNNQHLFVDSDEFVERLEYILSERKVVVAEEIFLVDGRVMERDYIPIFTDKEYHGHLWQYRDITLRKRAATELQYQLQRTLLLQQITEDIRSQLEPQKLFETAVVQIGQAFQASRCSLHIYTTQPVPDIPWVAEYVAPGWDSIMGAEIPVEGNPYAEQLLSQDRASVSPNVYHEPLLQPLVPLLEAIALKSMIAVRTSYQGEPNGAIILHQCDHYREWTEDECELLEAIAAQVGIAFAQVKSLEQEKKQREVLDYQNAILRQEIRSRKALERKLFQSRQFLDTILENIPIALFVKDINDDFRYVLWNHQAEVMYGVSRNQIIGRNNYEQDWLDRETADRFFSEDTQVLSTQELLILNEDEVECSIQNRKIQQRVVKVPLFDEQHQVTHILGIAEDISERKEQENAMRQARETADAANRAKSEFLANMSHELRTPLNTILGFTQLITNEHTLDRQAEEYLGIISRSGEHLLNLINDVLEMSKIEAGRTSLHVSNFDLYKLLGSLEEMFRLRATSKGLKLMVDLAVTVPQYIQSDEGKLRQVLINLLSNAIKFTQEGYVILRVKKATQEVTTASKSKHLHSLSQLWFEIEDTGPGIASDDLELLFEPFMQTATGQKSQEGTGLGLPISRYFVQLMGGELTVHSVVGQGSRFLFQIEMNLATAGRAGMRQANQTVLTLAPNHPSRRILVVDDHPANRRLLVKVLSDVGFEVKEANNGQEAIAVANDWHPHLIWMDIRMPVMDGYEATRQIKAIHPVSSPTIIALTASAFEEDRAKVLEAGCDDFVRKPFRKEVILDKIAEYLEVQYLYASAEVDNIPVEPGYGQTGISGDSAHNATRMIMPDSSCLAMMPPDWINQLQRAAVKGSDETILALISTMPPTQPELTSMLTHWVQHFQFDQILKLIDDYGSHPSS